MQSLQFLVVFHEHAQFRVGGADVVGFVGTSFGFGRARWVLSLGWMLSCHWRFLLLLIMLLLLILPVLILLHQRLCRQLGHPGQLLLPTNIAPLLASAYFVLAPSFMPLSCCLHFWVVLDECF